MGIRSMFSGVSGLQSHSTWLDVIGNNISNTNTVAYKASRVHFADQISQTQFPGAGPNPGSNLGGVNPQQVGLGTRVASIQTLFQQGPTQNTGLSTDIAIIGEGFLVAKSGGSTMLTRAGNLDFDGDGNLVDQNGGLIQGFNAQAQFIQRPIHSQAVANPPLVVTDMSLQLDNTDITQATNINIKRDFVIPPRATTVMSLSGNLDSFQQANAPGGVLDLAPGGVPVLPAADAAVAYNAAKVAAGPLAPYGFAIQQQIDFNDPVTAGPMIDPIVDPIGPLGRQVPSSIITGATTLAVARAIATNAWELQPPVPPAHVSASTVYDSLGNARSVTIQYYQVNDLGTAVPPVNTPPMNQVLYAWYAFDTTGGAPVDNDTLIAGTGILEGDDGTGVGYDRNHPAGASFFGDFLWFNTDGSPGSMGGAGVVGGVITPARPMIYLPPFQEQSAVPPGPPGPGPSPVSPIPAIGAEIAAIVLDFGTSGILGEGLRDGVYADAEGSYQFINGVNTYVPNHTAYVKEQDGYRDGQLLGVSFDKTGTIFGSFSNGIDVALAQVVLAMPDNPEGLSKIGGNYYVPTANSGPMFVGVAGQLGIGYVQGHALEGSNVDLTIELSNMIIAQRGFEVNARVISVTNSTLETVTRLGQ
jgi:flagellar hook protein FlgE